MSVAVARSSLTTALSRYSRSWGLWLLLLVAPIGARYMIPQGDGGDGGVIIAIGGQLPVMTSAFLGVSLGIVVSTLLLPIAWLYLRSNTNRRQPWQVEEVTAASRIAIALGRFGADAAVLLAMLAALTIAGWILGLVIGPADGWRPGDIALALWLVAAPALLGVAALRILFDAIPATRGGFGDLLYAASWMTSLIAPLGTRGREPGFLTNMADFAGFLPPLMVGAPGQADDFAIGGVDVLLPGHVALDVMAGLFSPGYIEARLAWAGIAVLVAVLAGLVYRPHRIGRRRALAGRWAAVLADGPPPPVDQAAAAAGRVAVPALALVVAEARLILAGRLLKLLAAAAFVFAGVGEFRHAASPAALLLLVFALTAHAGRSEARGLVALTATAPLSPWARRGSFVLAGTGLALLLAMPAMPRGGAEVLALASGTGLAVSLVAIIGAAISGSGFAPRLLLLIAWYAYLSS